MAFQNIPFTNDLKQVINVGDEVVVITTSTGNTSVKRGKYLGMCGKRVVVETQSRRVNWIKYPNEYNIEYYNRVSYLFENRIYAIDTPFVEMVGKYF